MFVNLVIFCAVVAVGSAITVSVERIHDDKNGWKVIFKGFFGGRTKIKTIFLLKHLKRILKNFYYEQEESKESKKNYAIAINWAKKHSSAWNII